MKEEKFNILGHSLVPEHIKLTEEQVQEVTKRLNISLKQFPSISSGDPVVKKLEAVPGDLIKIKRKSDTVGESEYYRVVTNE